jgi:hypothetical protein
LSDVINWTESLCSRQRYEEMVKERRRLADEAERQRAYERTEHARLEKLEKELAAMKK